MSFPWVRSEAACKGYSTFPSPRLAALGLCSPGRGSVSHAGSLPPAEVGVRPVGLCHLVQDVLPLDDRPLVVEGQEQFLRELFWHHCAAVLVLPALGDQPLHGQEALPIVRQRDGHLQRVKPGQLSEPALPQHSTSWHCTCSLCCSLQPEPLLTAENCQFCSGHRNWPLLPKWKCLFGSWVQPGLS